MLRVARACTFRCSARAHARNRARWAESGWRGDSGASLPDWCDRM